MDQETAITRALGWFHRVYKPGDLIKIIAARQTGGRWAMDITCDSIAEVVRIEIDSEGQIRRLGEG